MKQDMFSMGKRSVWSILLLLGLILATACQYPAHTFRPLTPQETQAFITNKQVTPVAIKPIDGATIILYDTDQQTGYYTASVDQGGGLVEQLVLVGGEGKPTAQSVPATAERPLATVVGTQTGTPFVAIVIHDRQVAQRIKSAKIVFDNDQTTIVQTDGQQGIIVEDPNAVAGWDTVVLYLASGEVVYRSSR